MQRWTMMSKREERGGSWKRAGTEVMWFCTVCVDDQGREVAGA